MQWIKPIGGGGDRTEVKSIPSQEDSQLLLGEPYTSTRSRCEKITNNFEASNHERFKSTELAVLLWWNYSEWQGTAIYKLLTNAERRNYEVSDKLVCNNI
ncbi:unnamed protein product [Haemonchus placei]|uniref:Uncharacterized protein n=1 Tax=Haemonchus placei TaxID=6290 RepID=A0A3P8A4A7_HAEPC|nr:unnamed protein product [Haemonchus placei]